MLIALCAAFVAQGFGQEARAQEDILRFVSLAAGEANLRTGPGLQYPIDWVYQRRGLPLAVVGERDTWRKVRDMDGVTGWMHVSLLTGRRTAMITGARRSLYASDTPGARVTMVAEPGVVGRLERCANLWCRVSVDGTRGWIEQRHLWGVLPGEVIE